jgi:hypothetical protein
MADASGVNYNVSARTQESGKPLFNKLHVGVVTHLDNKDKTSSEFIFGHMAEDFPKSQRNRENADKSTDADLVKWQLTALAYHLVEYSKKCGEDVSRTMNYEIELATGLPYHESINKEKKVKYALAFMGRHSVEFKHPDFAGLIVVLNIKKVSVFVEGEASFENIIFNENGRYSKIDPLILKDGIVVMIDIGGYSTEVVGVQFEESVSVNEDYDEFSEREIQVFPATRPDLTMGIQKGVGSVMMNVIADIERFEPKIQRKLTRRDIEKAMANKYDGTSGWLTPELINISEYFNKHAVNLAKDLAKDFINLYSNANVKSKIREIYLTGGGSRIASIVKTFKDELVLRGYEEGLIVLVPDATYSNCVGYYQSYVNLDGAKC